MATEIQPNEGKDDQGKTTLLSGASKWLALIHNKTVVNGDLIVTTTRGGGFGEITGTSYARAAVTLGVMANGILVVPGATFTVGAAVVDWPSDVSAVALMSALTNGVIDFIWDLTIVGSTTSASAVVTGIADTTGLVAGDKVWGPGIPAATTILSVDSPTQITLSANATASATATLAVSFNMALASAQLIIPANNLFFKNPAE